jgi:autoinducer 2-degrading protein
MLIISVTFKIKPDHLAAFREAILKNAAASLADEPGCDLFDVCEDKDGIIYLYERYSSNEAFDLHLKAPHYLSFDQLTAAWIDSKKVERYTLISPV